jgi:V/A-type H+-transporting ATPase subunit E
MQIGLASQDQSIYIDTSFIKNRRIPMAEELKHLIEQIQKEGVEKANEQAETIISQAKEKAARIVSEAEDKAHQVIKKAEEESSAFAERSIKTLEQAARDLLITVGQGCEKVATGTLGKQVESTLSGDFLESLIRQVVEQSKDSGLRLTVSESDKSALAGFCAEEARKAGAEIELVSDAEVLSGFKVAYKDRNVYLDYTGEAIAEALSAFLRPELAKIVSAIAQEQQVSG